MITYILSYIHTDRKNRVVFVYIHIATLIKISIESIQRPGIPNLVDPYPDKGYGA